MYSKLYARITESSLMEEPINVRYTFVLMLAIADPEGYVIGTDVAIARRLNMKLDEFRKCLQVLMAPDLNSNSKEREGRRIIVSNGERGYQLVNYASYRDMKDPKERRDYMRDYMRDYRAKKSQPIDGQVVADDVNACKPELAGLTHAEGDAYGDGEAEGDVNAEEEIHPVVVAWNSAVGVVMVRKITPSRLHKLNIRLKDPSWDWQAAIAKFPLKLFASQPDGWRPTFDWFLRPDTVTSILEGKYDWEKKENKNGKQDRYADGRGQRYQGTDAG